MSIIESGIKKEEIKLHNNQKVIITYGDGTKDNFGRPEERNWSSKRLISLYDEDGKLLGSRVEDNPYEFKRNPGIIY
jgi:hypothetical protein